MLLLTTVRSRAPDSTSARMRVVGLPERPNPPTATVIPSRAAARTASAALSTSLPIRTPSSRVPATLPRGRSGAPRREWRDGDDRAVGTVRAARRDHGARAGARVGARRPRGERPERALRRRSAGGAPRRIEPRLVRQFARGERRDGARLARRRSARGVRALARPGALGLGLRAGAV